jgi:hypothetical protein
VEASAAVAAERAGVPRARRRLAVTVPWSTVVDGAAGIVLRVQEARHGGVVVDDGLCEVGEFAVGVAGLGAQSGEGLIE